MKVYQNVLEMLKNKEQGVLITVLNGTPAFDGLIGQHLIWCPEDELALAWKNQIDSEMWEKLINLCLKTLDKREFHRARLEMGEEWLDLMLEVILPVPRLVILGCGHVGQAVAKLGDILGWDMVVVDDRPVFANQSLFSERTKVVCTDFSKAIEQIGLGENDYIVIVTRGHQYDRIVLETLAERKMAYIGLIGSKRRVRGLFDDLTKDGVTREWLDSLHSPIGLAIGAETPEEIAISIMAEIIQVQRKGEV